MSDENEKITRTPTANSLEDLVKDAKKVAAGKKLAECNKKAKEAIETVKSKMYQSKTPKQSSDIDPLLIGLTAVALFLRYMSHHQEAATNQR